MVRGILPPVFQLFDFAAPDRPVAQRDVSTVPSQALFLMNNSWVIDQSQRAALRLLSESNRNDEQRVQLLFQLAYARRATDAELAAVIEYLNRGESLMNEKANPATATSEQVHQTRWSALCQVIFASAEFRVLK